MSEYTPRYPGRRWKVGYGNYAGVERFAVRELYAILQQTVPYVPECLPAAALDERADQHVALIGTPEANPRLAELAARGLLELPRRPESYTLACLPSPWTPQGRVVAVAGRDAAGVLHGVMDFHAHCLLPVSEESGEGGGDAFARIADCRLAGSPAIELRGVWTWGYVIYDYRRFLDNMARLKLNLLTVWNDCPPLNIHEVLAYAHSRGIEVFLGFHWGWGLNLDLAKESDRLRIRDFVLREFETRYGSLDLDGVYFQTLTEHHNVESGGRTVAAMACDLVNDISRRLLERRPALKIQFGLHATSIQDHYPDLGALDPRVLIVWEDAGALPFSYRPEPLNPHAPEPVRSSEQTLEYALKLAGFRREPGFGMVAKGWTTLDWAREFEHHGPFVMGERLGEFTARRLAGRQPHWDEINALWRQHYGLAARFYRELLKSGLPSVTVCGLIEDGLLEERIQPSVGLFAETLWDPRPEDELLLRRGEALSRAGNLRG